MIISHTTLMFNLINNHTITCVTTVFKHLRFSIQMLANPLSKHGTEVVLVVTELPTAVSYKGPDVRQRVLHHCTIRKDHGGSQGRHSLCKEEAVIFLLAVHLELDENSLYMLVSATRCMVISTL